MFPYWWLKYNIQPTVYRIELHFLWEHELERLLNAWLIKDKHANDAHTGNSISSLYLENTSFMLGSRASLSKSGAFTICIIWFNTAAETFEVLYNFRKAFPSLDRSPAKCYKFRRGSFSKWSLADNRGPTHLSSVGEQDRAPMASVCCTQCVLCDPHLGAPQDPPASQAQRLVV